MVTHEEALDRRLAAMSYAERQRWWRQREIEQAIAWGMPEHLDWVKPLEENREDQLAVDSTGTGVAEDRGSVYLPGDWLDELDKRYPEDAEFFRRMREYFPEGHQWVEIVDPDSAAGQEFFGRLKSEFPEAWNFFLREVE